LKRKEKCISQKGFFKRDLLTWSNLQKLDHTSHGDIHFRMGIVGSRGENFQTKKKESYRL
jgi:hypothetical protein